MRETLRLPGLRKIADTIMDNLRYKTSVERRVPRSAPAPTAGHRLPPRLWREVRDQQRRLAQHHRAAVSSRCGPRATSDIQLERVEEGTKRATLSSSSTSPPHKKPTRREGAQHVSPDP